jgi:hypothetical protein
MGPMKAKMLAAQSKLQSLLEQHELTTGMYVRVYGDHLILGRAETLPGSSDPENIDRVRLTRLSSSTWGLSVRRHTGRWERTPWSGNMKEMLDTILSFMQHLIATYD